MSHMLGTDLETTGLAKTASTTEIALVHYNGEERLSHFVIKIRPESDATIGLGALKITRQTPYSLYQDAHPPEDAANLIVNYLCEKVFPIVGNKKLQWLGHNVYGDVSRIRQLLEKVNYNQWDDIFDYHLKDTAPMGSLLRDAGLLTMDKLSLATLAESLQIEADKTKLHGALYDIEVTFKCYFKMIKLLRGLHGKAVG